jgi:K+-sensing histidine kinase KdpD
LDSDGKVIGVIGISIDTTEKAIIEETLKHTEHLLEKSITVKNRFLRNISHEVRNPLQAFVTTAESLADNWNSFSDQDKFEAVQLIANSARRLSNMVINTFDLSDLISKDNQLKLKNDNLTTLIRSSINSFNALSLDNNRSQIIMAQSKDYQLVFDAEKIKQVMTQLLMNAIKWTSPNKLIQVELHETLLPNSSIRGIQCCVKDEGIHIPEEELEFIFEPFTESSATASKACGVGLGLALCKEIINLHMGVIWAENNLKQGVTLNFIIPTILSENI